MDETAVKVKQSRQAQEFQAFFEKLQDTICAALEEIDGKEVFVEDLWTHETGGGGRTRIIQNGDVFEKGGVNTSAVSGILSPKLADRLGASEQAFFATGISLVLHPYSPMIPTVHTNFRYLELADGTFWVGGGADLTPYYLFDEDVRHFHRTWKEVCDRHNSEYYSRFKTWCDEYFFLPHRAEGRGVGGIFFDYLKGEFTKLHAFVRDCSNAFLQAYTPIVKRRLRENWSKEQKEWQLHRRGRYVEFNLLYDRGTLFGLETRGRTESILMSLPPVVKWGYNIQPKPGSREERLIEVLRNPQPWA
ncbi:MAG TPA: oxygen-dependent coproporphyrinogen oxidase [Bacteroidota bacterium]|nr:oxygen-dependent coproporphyrinogen oxidase [Bacteroidota bacterium]